MSDYNQLAEAEAIRFIIASEDSGLSHEKALGAGTGYEHCLKRLLPIIDRLLKGHDEGCPARMAEVGMLLDTDECKCGYTEAVEQARKLLSPPPSIQGDHLQ